MSDHEIMRGNVSFLRKPRKLKQGGDAIKNRGLKSFAYRKGTQDMRKAQEWSKTFSKGMARSLLNKKQ